MIINVLLSRRSDYYVMKKETDDRRIMPLFWKVSYGRELRVLGAE